MEAFIQKFIEEATEHINTLEETLLQLENDSNNKSLVEIVFRSMHSLKGGGAMFGFEEISHFTHNLENIYDLVRNDKMEVTKDLLTLTLQSVDHLKKLLEEGQEISPETQSAHGKLLNKIESIVESSGKSGSTQESNDSGEDDSHKGSATYYIHFIPNADIQNNGTNPLYLIDELTSLGKAIVIPNYSKIPDLEKIDPEKCYISWEVLLTTDLTTEEIHDVFIFAEDLCQLEIETLSTDNLLNIKSFVKKVNNRIDYHHDIGLANFKEIEKESKKGVASKVKRVIEKTTPKTFGSNTISSIRVASEKLDNLMNLVSELVTTQARLQLYSENESSNELTSISENIQKLSRELRDIAFSIVLIPIGTIITRFQRLVRDLSSELEKEITLDAEGTDTELDKTIIENLTDPIMHLIRNSIDHGLETPAERKKLGKDPTGKILIKSYYSGANVHIEILDDGRGIDVEKIRQKAVNMGFITDDTSISEREILDFIFLPGFSTAKNITDVSGRGVGMDVVKRKISEIRGEVDIATTANVGTTFTIKLPLTLSIIDGLLVKVNNTRYILPLAAVGKIYAVEHKKVESAFNNVIIVDDQKFPFFYLRKEFDIEGTPNDIEELILINYDDQSVGIVVDTVIGEYQAVLKPLGKYYKEQEIISGASILGDGTIALVLDSNKAVNFFHRKVAEDMI